MDEVASDTLSIICDVSGRKEPYWRALTPSSKSTSSLTWWKLLDQTLTCKSGMISPCHLALRKAQSQTSNKKVYTHKII